MSDHQRATSGAPKLGVFYVFVALTTFAWIGATILYFTWTVTPEIERSE